MNTSIRQQEIAEIELMPCALRMLFGEDTEGERVLSRRQIPSKLLKDGVAAFPCQVVGNREVAVDDDRRLVVQLHFCHAEITGIFLEANRHDGAGESDFQKGSGLVCLEGSVAAAMGASRPSVVLEDGKFCGVHNTSRRIAERIRK